MPISQFSEGLQKALSFMPGTYGTSLLRNHAMRGPLAEMEAQGVPTEMIDAIKDTIDCNVYYFDKVVPIGTMLTILGTTTIVLISVYVLLNVLKKHRAK